MNRVNQAVTGYVAAFSDLSFNVLPVVLYLGHLARARCGSSTGGSRWP